MENLEKLQHKHQRQVQTRLVKVCLRRESLNCVGGKSKVRKLLQSGEKDQITTTAKFVATSPSPANEVASHKP